MAPDEKGRRRAADLKGLSVSLLGFAFVCAWDDLAFARVSALFPAEPWFGQDLMTLGMVPVFVVLVLAGRRLAPLYRRRGIVLAAPLLMTAAVGLYVGAVVSGTIPWILAAALAAGLGAGLAILQWAELQSCLNSLQIVLYVSGGFCLGSIMSWLGLGLGEDRLAVLMLALPWLSVASLRVGFGRIAPEDLPREQWGRLRFPWKLVIVLGVYEFAVGVAQGEGALPGSVLIVGTIAASASLFVLAYFLSHRFDFTRIYRTPFVLMVCGLLVLLPSFATFAPAASLLVATGYALMFLLMTMLLCDLSHRYGVSAAVLCSIEELVMLSRIGGHGVGAGVLAGGWGQEGVAVALTVLVVIASMVLLSEREYSKWDATFFGVGSRDREQDERMAFAQHCIEVAERYRLSPREKEVFQLLAEGKAATDIERELYIASGTLKSHTRRIYQKLDIHSRSELHELLQAEEAFQ